MTEPGTWSHWKQRAEAAEKELGALRKLWDTCGLPERELVKRAEAAESRIDDLSRELTAEIEAHRVTREKIAELVREVREWNRVSFGVRWPSLEAILDRHEPKP